MIRILSWLMGILSRLYTYNIHSWLKRFGNLVYSLWLQNSFKLATGVHFQSPTEVVGGKNISIGANTYFGSDLELHAWDQYKKVKHTPIITIGTGCSFGKYNTITCSNQVKIGNNLLTGRRVTISDNNHGDTESQTLLLPPLERPLVEKGDGVVIGNNVWIGDNSIILSGVELGDGVVVGANSVVTKSFPAYCIIAGNPAKIIKQH